jgi:HSP20 family protein
MNFNQKSIGIGTLTNLKKRSKKNFSTAEKFHQFLHKDKTNSVVETDEEAQLSVDVYETNTDLFIVAPLAGVDTDEINIEITEDVVVIEGERLHPLPKVTEKDLLVNECFFGPFTRSIVLPEAVDSKRAQAEFKKNILILSMPKLDSARTRVIKIRKKE